MGQVADAVEELLAHLDGLGRLEDVDGLRVAALRGLAVAVEAKPTDARLWAQLRDAGEVLTARDAGRDGFADLMEQLRAGEVSTEVRDPTET